MNEKSIKEHGTNRYKLLIQKDQHLSNINQTDTTPILRVLIATVP
jgi:hypothetical protein